MCNVSIINFSFFHKDSLIVDDICMLARSGARIIALLLIIFACKRARSLKDKDYNTGILIQCFKVE